MRSGARTVLLHVAVLMSVSFGAGATAGPDDTATLGQSIVLARLEEIKAIGVLMAEQTWPGFDPLAVPAILYEPGGWAFAIGFPEPPSGFAAIEGVKHGERALYRAPVGSFAHKGRSPALIDGRWAVISTFEPPRVAPAGARMGREAGEEGLGRFVGDAFAIFLMERRGRKTPFVTGPAAYPESAELMALTTLENRAMTTPLQLASITEKNIDAYHRMFRAVVAIRHARWKLMGEEVAGLEREIELTEGLRLYTETMVHRYAMNRLLVSTGPEKGDGSFVRWVNGGAMRMLGVGYPMFSTADNPAFTLPQVAVRGAILAALVDKSAAAWRPDAISGDTALIDLLARMEKLERDAEPAILAEVKKEYEYEPILKLAEDDLARLQRDRAAWRRSHFPPGPALVEIVLPAGEAATYADDPWTTGHLGGGALTHPGGLTLKTGGIEIEAAPAAEGGAGLILTESGSRRQHVNRVILALPSDGSLSVAGKPYKRSEKPRPVNDMEPLTIEAPGLKLRAGRGSILRKPDGSLQVTITH